MQNLEDLSQIPCIQMVFELSICMRKSKWNFFLYEELINFAYDVNLLSAGHPDAEFSDFGTTILRVFLLATPSHLFVLRLLPPPPPRNHNEIVRS
jgi:hypothetical protein